MTPHDPAASYKMLFTHRGGHAHAHHGLNPATSLDGLHWSEPRMMYHRKSGRMTPEVGGRADLGGFLLTVDESPSLR